MWTLHTKSSYTIQLEQDVGKSWHHLNMDHAKRACLKAIILFNPGTVNT